MRTGSRSRHEVSAPMLAALWPLFRYSQPRRAYVLRVLGERHGPVLIKRRPGRD